MSVFTSAASSGDYGDPPPKELKCSSSSSLLLLPDDIIVDCFARVPRSYYLGISLVCTNFRRLIASPDIYKQRSALLCTENVLYVVLRSDPTETPRLYTLNLKPFGNMYQATDINYKLVPIPSVPSIPFWGMSIVVVNSDIYILGGFFNNQLVSTGFVIECPSHTIRVLPSMKQARGSAAAGVVDGKLYVIGGCDNGSQNWIEALDLNTQTWESVSVLSNLQMHNITIRSFVINEKIYIMDRENSYVYDPKKGRIKSDWLLNVHWNVCSCVVDNKLYSYRKTSKIWMFDPIKRIWYKVKGLKDLPEKHFQTRMANHGGKLAIMFDEYEGRSIGIWYTEIGLEWREGKMWGKILWSKLVMALKHSSTILQSLDVTV